MKHVSDLVHQPTRKTGSTKNFSDREISDPIRAAFSMFKANYKGLFKSQYEKPEDLNRDMRLWQYEFGHLPAQRIKQAALEAIARCKFPPKISDFREAVDNTRQHAAHQQFKMLPKPPLTAAEVARGRKALDAMRRDIASPDSEIPPIR